MRMSRLRRTGPVNWPIGKWVALNDDGLACNCFRSHSVSWTLPPLSVVLHFRNTTKLPAKAAFSYWLSGTPLHPDEDDVRFGAAIRSLRRRKAASTFGVSTLSVLAVLRLTANSNMTRLDASNLPRVAIFDPGLPQLPAMKELKSCRLIAPQVEQATPLPCATACRDAAQRHAP